MRSPNSLLMSTPTKGFATKMTGARRDLVSAIALLVCFASVAQAQTHYAFDTAASGNEFRLLSTGDRDASDGWSDTDAEVIFGYDYATTLRGNPLASIEFPAPVGIPEAPNTQPGDTPRTGVLMAADQNIFINAAGISSISATALDPNDTSQLLSINGNYEVQVDLWMNYRIGSGSATEYAGLFTGHDGVRYGHLSGAGFAYAGDTGAVSDHRLYKSASASEGLAALTGADENAAWGAQDQFITVDGSNNLTGSDGQYNPEIGLTYLDDPQFDPQPRAALDGENDFWQNAFTDRFDLGAGLEPYFSQGPSQGGPSPAFNAPGDLGFRWATIRMEVEPNTLGTGSRNEPGIARVYVRATWQDDGDEDLGTVDPVTVVGPEVFVGTIDNSIDAADLTGFTPEVIDFTQGISLNYFDGFASNDETDMVFGVFDNLIITPEVVTLAGDYNGNGTVDAADYTLWRDTLGDSVTPGEGADGDGDGTIGAGDYSVWETNFGMTSSSSSNAVPEPSAAILAVSALLLAMGSRRESR